MGSLRFRKYLVDFALLLGYATEYMRTTIIRETEQKVGEDVELFGWVNVRRDHGKLIFIDLRDRSGVVQVVFTPHVGEEVYSKAKELRSEYVICVKGSVKERPDNLKNPDMETGGVEVEVKELEILNEAHTPPLDVTSDGKEIGEEVRMEYRYLDLRRPRLQKNIALRHRIIKHIRDFLDERDFFEIETPILTKSTPEGARDYVVPSRLQPGDFYALPQSPQQYKQLLMVSGFERYFQIARCFRDEDTRGDRQPEFTQLDLEMSFVDREDVMKLNEELLIELVHTHAPGKKIQDIPFPRLSYKEAMEQYGTDRPDLRKDKNDPNLLSFVWIVDFPFFEKTDEGKLTFTHNPFSRPKEEHVKVLRDITSSSPSGSFADDEEVENILTTQYDVVLNGWEVGGGSIRNYTHEDLLAVFKVLGYSAQEIEEQFEALDLALQYGAPPHGGIAWGLDRLVMILANEPNIREVIAFPKTGDGRDLMMKAPSEIRDQQKEELHIKITNPDEEKSS